ncbi:MAG: histidinol-phosphate transaminase [Eubacteriales bacterium]|nr:histidinol-phosphate transaminase [Eubacteriales bacterium]
MSKYFNSFYKELTPYTPGEQPQDKKYIKLNTNESPYIPAPGVIDVINSKEAADLRLYSDPELKPLKAELARAYGVEPKNVFVGNGSDEVLYFAFMAFGEAGLKFADITYGCYKVFAAVNGLKTEIVPLKDDLSLDPSDYMDSGKAVVIANPNAPTGMTISLEDIAEIAKSNAGSVVMIDEAYVDFGAESAVELTKEFDNLLVVQTFSKSRSLAGARVGYAIGNEELIADLETLKFSFNPYNVNRLSMAAAVEAVKAADYYKDACGKIAATREWTTKELTKLGFTVLPSKSNFIFAKTPDYDGKKLYLDLKDRGILIRHFDSARISDYNRITIGTQEDMETFVATVKELLAK